MIKKIDINEVERAMPNGVPARLRGLDTGGNGINISTDKLKTEIYKSKAIKGGNLNDVVEVGEYTVYSTVINIPSYSFHWLKVIGYGDVVQIAISFNTLEERRRSYVNKIWSNWK